MITKENAQKKISELVERFEEQYASYKKSEYNETSTRRDFIDPFFKALGWDIDNEQGFAQSYREVIHEDKVKIGKATRAPDYSFRIGGGKRLFFVEAKKPSVFIKDEILPAYQVRRYGWNAKLSVSLITDFEEFAVYDCSKKPLPTDKASVARVEYFTFRDYINKFDFLWNTFSKEAVLKGSFDKYVQGTANKKGTSTVDKEFLISLDKWRTYLATSISLRNKELDEDEINFAVQQTLDRIIFLRIAEDRGVEVYGNMKNALKQGDYFENLYGIFKEADDKYNSGLFDFKKDQISRTLKIDNKVIRTIVTELYYPESPYEFSILSVEILGSAYEQFLGKTITIDSAHRAKIEEKPEVRKAGGVYYTPQYVVDYIVQHTVGKLIENKKPEEVSSIKIVDPACGSGSFLIGAYAYLMQWHNDYYIKKLGATRGHKKGVLTPDGHLSTAEKKRILINNIYGVDIDVNAVEVTKLSLLLKCMEGETEASISHQFRMFNERVLPTLDDNIKSGNSLVDTDFYGNELFEQEKKTKPFSWQKTFPEIFSCGGFDVVIGNPPYVMSDLNEIQKNYLINKYKFQEGKPDLYRFFVEQSHLIIKDGGRFSFIIPNSILTIPSCKKLREYLITNGGANEIVFFWGQVFEKVSINSIIFSTQKGSKSPKINIINDQSGKPDSNSLCNAEQNKTFLLKSEILNTLDCQIQVGNNDEISKIIAKIVKSAIVLSEVSTYTLGMQVYHNSIHTKSDIENRIYHSEKKIDASYFPESGGSNIKPYQFINKFKEFVSYGVWCYNKPDWKFCSQERILIREIPNKSTLNCCLSDTIHVSNKAVIMVIGKDVSNKFLLGILNSNLLGFYVFNSTEKGNQRLFPRISLTTIRNLPIINLNLENQTEKSSHDEIIKLVDQLLQLNEEKQGVKLDSNREQIQGRIDYCEGRINEIVYELYGLTPEEIAIVKSSGS